MENRAFRKFEWSVWKLLDCTKYPRASRSLERPPNPLPYRTNPLWKFLPTDLLSFDPSIIKHGAEASLHSESTSMHSAVSDKKIAHRHGFLTKAIAREEWGTEVAIQGRQCSVVATVHCLPWIDEGLINLTWLGLFILLQRIRRLILWTQPQSKQWRQGCVLASTLFGIIFACCFHKPLTNQTTGFTFTQKSDGCLFNLARLRTKTKVRKVLIREMLFADDPAVNALTEEVLQRLLNSLPMRVKSSPSPLE